MQRSPRVPSLAGFSSQGALLALVGAGVAAFVLFVLPRMSASRAAGPTPHPRPEAAAVDGTPPAETVQLVQAAEVDPDPEPPVLLAETPTAAAVGLAGEETEPVKVPKVEGPKLKYERGTGKAEVIDNRVLRAPRREQRKERRERAAALAAQGVAVEAQPEPQKAKAAPNPDRWRVSNRSGTGRTGIGKGKGKKGG